MSFSNMFQYMWTILIVFKKWHYVLPEDDTHVPQHVGESHLLFVPI